MTEPIVIEAEEREWPDRPDKPTQYAQHGPLPGGWVPRVAWGARPPKSNPGSLASLDSITVHYTGGSNAPTDHTGCAEFMRGIQDSHQAIEEQSDIEYQVTVCPHGSIFEGRVWGYKGGANGTATANQVSASVCALIGLTNGNPTQPTDTLLSAVDRACRDIEASYGRPGTVRVGHFVWKPTACPGDPLIDWLAEGCPVDNATDDGELYQGEAYDVLTLWFGVNFPDQVGTVAPALDRGNPVVTQTALYDVLTLWSAVNPGIAEAIRAGAPTTTTEER